MLKLTLISHIIKLTAHILNKQGNIVSILLHQYSAHLCAIPTQRLKSEQIQVLIIILAAIKRGRQREAG